LKEMGLRKEAKKGVEEGKRSRDARKTSSTPLRHAPARSVESLRHRRVGGLRRKPLRVAPVELKHVNAPLRQDIGILLPVVARARAIADTRVRAGA
jgi:hypothetical protein